MALNLACAHAPRVSDNSFYRRSQLRIFADGLLLRQISSSAVAAAGATAHVVRTAGLSCNRRIGQRTDERDLAAIIVGAHDLHMASYYQAKRDQVSGGEAGRASVGHRPCEPEGAWKTTTARGALSHRDCHPNLGITGSIGDECSFPRTSDRRHEYCAKRAFVAAGASRPGDRVRAAQGAGRASYAGGDDLRGNVGGSDGDGLSTHGAADRNDRT